MRWAGSGPLQLCLLLGFRQLGSDAPELVQRKLQAGHDLRCDLVRRREAIGIGGASILEPEDVEVELVALDQIVVLGAAPATFQTPVTPRFLAFVPVRGVVARDDSSGTNRGQCHFSAAPSIWVCW